MLRKYSGSKQIMKETQKKFGEFIQPTILTQAQFFKLFKPKKSIGQGSYGTIKCIENCYGEQYAIKESKDNEETYGLYRQFSIMKKFNHPHLLKAIGFYQIKESQKLIILTEYCKHKSLKVFSPNLASFFLEDKYRLCVQIFNGIYALHMKNIMHRDLKPQNVLIDGNKHAKICDFGFCKYDIETDLSKTLRVGTPLYNSPELQQGTYTKKCDIFSYGLIVYFIFSNGKHLFKKYDTLEDLKSSKRQQFKLGPKAFEDLDVVEQIKKLLQNTITEKQDERYSTVEVKQFWQRFIRENSLKGLKVGDLKEKYGSILFLDEQEEKSLSTQNQTTLIDSERFTVQLLPRIVENCQAFQDLTKLIELCNSITEIEQKMTQFKSEIENIDIKLTEKNIISFGCLLILEIHLQNLVSFGTKLLESQLLLHKQELTLKLESYLNQILRMRQFIIKNLLKVTKYLYVHRYLIKPTDLFSNFMLNCFEEAKKQEYFLNDVFGSQKSMEDFKAVHQIETNSEFYKLIDQKYQIKINLTTFKFEFNEMISKFRREKQNLSNEDETSKTNEVVAKIKSIAFLKY